MKRLILLLLAGLFLTAGAADGDAKGAADGKTKGTTDGDAKKSGRGKSSMSDLRGLETRNSRLPFYQKDRLQLMVYSEVTVRHGNLITATNPLMDLIRAQARVDSITTGPGTVLYPLEAPLRDVADFWKGRILFSEGVLHTTRADIDQERRKAAGTEPVHFRSPLADIDGVGFEADFDARTLLVKREVEIILRTEASNPEKIFSTGVFPDEYGFIKLTGDSLFFDMAKNEITLFGNVRVTEPRGTVTCEKMIVYLDSDSPEKPGMLEGLADARAAGQAGLSESGFRGISRIVWEDNVIMQSPGANGEVRTAHAERVVYEMDSGLISLTGNEQKLPFLRSDENSIRGEEILIYRNEEKMQVNRRSRMDFRREDRPSGDAASQPSSNSRVTSDHLTLLYGGGEGLFSGNVKVDDPEMKLECEEMQVRFAETAGTEERGRKAAGEPGLVPEFERSGRMELTEVNCSGGVKMIRRLAPEEPAQSARAETASLDYTERVITLSGGNPTLFRGEDHFSGDELKIFWERELMRSNGNTKLLLCSAPASAAAVAASAAEPAVASTAEPGTVITSDFSDLDFGGNKLTFRGRVELRDARLALDCEVMDIYLKDKDGGKTEEKAAAGAMDLEVGSSRKVLDKIICTGEVFARDAKFKLNTDVLTLIFRQLPPGVEPTPGMLQSSGTELITILCDGKVKLRREADEAGAASSGSSGLPGVLEGSGGAGPMVLTSDRGKVDIPGNLTEFHGKVKVVEERGVLESESLYLYTREVAAVAPTATERPAPDIDVDPTVAAATDESVPSRILVGEGKELTQAIGEKNVIMTRRLPDGGVQKATGERVVYEVASRDVTLTGDAENPPVLEDRKHGRMSNPGGRIILNLANESVRTDGGRGQVDLRKLEGLEL